MNKKIFTVSLTIFLFLSGCSNNNTEELSMYKEGLIKTPLSKEVKKFQEQTDTKTNKPLIQATETQNTSTNFIESLINQLPKSYKTIANSNYSTMDNNGYKIEKAIEVKPCDEIKLDPSHSPLCFTKLYFLERKTTKNLEEYIKTNKHITDPKEWVQATYKQKIPYIYTKKASFRPGPLGDAAYKRKNFIYQLVDGNIVEAEIQFWPFKNNQYTQTPDSEVQNIIDTYENILIQ